MAGKVTSIEVQKRNPRRASLYVDGEFVCGLQLIHAAKLSKGQYLDDRDIEALQATDGKERAYERALNFLSYRPRSIAEVARRLSDKGFADSAVQAAIERLCRAKLLDDRAFASYWIHNREQFRPRGSYALRRELGQKGVDGQIIDDLLQEIDETESAYRVGLQLVDRWSRSKNAQSMDQATMRRKLIEHLRRRGFGYAIAREVWDRIQAERVAVRSDVDEEENTAWDQEP